MIWMALKCKGMVQYQPLCDVNQSCIFIIEKEDATWSTAIMSLGPLDYQPLRARVFAVASPIPEVASVMNATLSSRFPMNFSLLYWVIRFWKLILYLLTYSLLRPRISWYLICFDLRLWVSYNATSIDVFFLVSNYCEILNQIIIIDSVMSLSTFVIPQFL